MIESKIVCNSNALFDGNVLNAILRKMEKLSVTVFEEWFDMM